METALSECNSEQTCAVVVGMTPRTLYPWVQQAGKAFLGTKCECRQCAENDELSKFCDFSGKERGPPGLDFVSLFVQHFFIP